MAKYPDTPVTLSKDDAGEFQPISFKDFSGLVDTFAWGLHKLGVERGTHVGIIADNRKEWLITDLAVLSLGGIDVPRGSDSTADEISYILAHADCPISIAENQAQAEKILSKEKELPGLKALILYDGAEETKKKSKGSIKIHSFQEIMESGKEGFDQKYIDDEIEKGNSDEIATLIYTSGTTGEPKGVMLSHRSYNFQIDRIYRHVPIAHGHILLSVLPIWHSFERVVEYVTINAGATLAYSKPIGSIMIPDMGKVRPHWLPSVPRIWEGVRSAVYKNAKKGGGAKKVLFSFFVGVGESYAVVNNLFKGLVPRFSHRSRSLDKIISIIPLILLTPLKLLGDLLVFGKLKKLLGGRFIAGISGGGALPSYVDHFFQAAGILLLEGYGLTETGPVISARMKDHPVTDTIGPPLRDIETLVLDKEGAVLPPGKKGVLYVKSPQIMDGYYKRQDATDEVLKDGWLNTGDIAIMTIDGEIKILGRAKETIVLLGGENIEPVPIEDKLCESPVIQLAMVLGQDKKYLAAFIVPDYELIEEYAQKNEISYISRDELLTNPEIQEYVHDEIQGLVNQKSGFKHYERIFRFSLMPEAFEVGKELTHTLKIRRNVVNKLYHKKIEALFQ